MRATNLGVADAVYDNSRHSTSDVLQKIERKDLSWDRYFDLSSQEIGELMRAPKFGKALHRFIHQVPRLELSAHVQPILEACSRWI